MAVIMGFGNSLSCASPTTRNFLAGQKTKSFLVSASHDEYNRRLRYDAPVEGAVRKSVGIPSGRWRSRSSLAGARAVDEVRMSRSSGFEVALQAPPIRASARGGSMGLSSLVTAAQPPGIYTQFPILLQPWMQALNRGLTTIYGIKFKELYII